MCGCGCNQCGNAKKSTFRKADFEAIKKGFERINIVIENEEELKMLQRLAEAGGDKAGVLVDDNKNPIHFDYYEVVCEALISNLKK